MAIKLVAVDVDGTLVTADQQILPRVRQAAARAAQAGIELVLCTGRAECECWYVLEQLPQLRYLISHTGSMVQDLKTREILYHCPLSADDARRIYSRLREYDGLVSLFADGKVYNPSEQVAQFTRYYPESFRVLFDHSHTYLDDMDGWLAARQEPIEKYYVAYSGPEQAALAKKALSDLPYFVTGAGFIDLEVMSPATSKGIALRALAERLGLQRGQILAVGDSCNDLAMLDYAGTGVAMGNGEDALKAAADWIAPSNEEGGVADVLEKVIKGEF